MQHNSSCLTWDNIISDIFEKIPVSPKYFYKNNFHLLSEFGFDIDFEDYLGNTLLFHLLLYEEKNINFFNLKDLILYTKKINHINNNKENILFGMILQINRLQEQFIINFIKEHPELNIHQKNNLDRNILFNCTLSSNPPCDLINFLIQNNIETGNIDIYNYNHINNLVLSNFNENTSDIFIKLNKKNSILNKNKYNLSFLTFLLESLKNKHSENNFKWINFVCEKLINNELCENLNLFKNVIEPYTHLSQNYDNETFIIIKKMHSFLKNYCITSSIQVKKTYINKL